MNEPPADQGSALPPRPGERPRLGAAAGPSPVVRVVGRIATRKIAAGKAPAAATRAYRPPGGARTRRVYEVDRRNRFYPPRESTGMCTVRLVYIVSAYKLPDQVVRLVRRLRAQGTTFFVLIPLRKEIKRDDFGRQMGSMAKSG